MSQVSMYCSVRLSLKGAWETIELIGYLFIYLFIFCYLALVEFETRNSLVEIYASKLAAPACRGQNWFHWETLHVVIALPNF